MILIILFLGILKEGLSDYKRTKMDKLVNGVEHQRVVKVVNLNKSETPSYSYETETIHCQDIQVGDLIILKDNMVVPADCLLIKAPTTGGECAVATSQLDGERSLKPKYAPKVTQS